MVSALASWSKYAIRKNRSRWLEKKFKKIGKGTQKTRQKQKSNTQKIQRQKSSFQKSFVESTARGRGGAGGTGNSSRWTGL